MLNLTLKEISQATNIKGLEETKERLESIETGDNKVYQKGLDMYVEKIQKRINTLLENK